jgi:hypothetical protein
MPSLPTHSLDDNITFLLGLPKTKYLGSNRKPGAHTMLVPSSGTTENSSTPLHLARTYLPDSEILNKKDGRQVDCGMVFPDSK